MAKQDSKNKQLEKLMGKYGINEKDLELILKSGGGEKELPVSHEVYQVPFNSKRIKFGVVSDLHMGHKNFQPQILDHYRKYGKKQGVEFTLMPGDILEGMSGRDGHVYELSKIGATQQMEYGISQLEKISDKPIFGITASNSHDGWFSSKRNMGFEIGPELEKQVPGFHFLGYDEADLELDNGLKLRMRHPGDGTAYAECFDEKTEILTEDGWKFFSELERGERVATINKSKMLFEWQKPHTYTDEPFKGIMLHFKSRTVDLLVTPNHRMLVRKYPKRKNHVEKLLMPQKSHRKIDWNWQVKRADELRGCKQTWQFLRGGQSWEGTKDSYYNIPCRLSKNKGVKVKHLGEVPIELLAELIGWYVTEGYIRKSQVSICQSKRVNPENHERIMSLFEALGFQPRACGRDSKDITVGSMELAEWLVKQCGSGSRHKKIPKWLKEQSSETLSILFETLISGDGWKGSTGFGYRSISERLLDDVSEIAHKLGYATTKRDDSIYISNVQITPTLNKKPESIYYDGRIYCVGVPNSFILVRRNGRAVWTGNSYKIQKYINSITGGDKPNFLAQGHYHKALYMLYRNIHAIESGSLQSQTIFMKKRNTPSVTGYWIIDMAGDEKGISRLRPEFVSFYE